MSRDIASFARELASVGLLFDLDFQGFLLHRRSVEASAALELARKS